ncbi:MAG: ROK family protein [Dermatophilaceae bacterium]
MRESSVPGSGSESSQLRGGPSALEGGGAADGLVLAVDIGGTKIAAGLVDGRGCVSGRSTVTTPAEGAQAVLAAAIELGRSVCDAAGVSPVAVGVGSVGVIDARRGVVTQVADAPPGWVGTDVAGALRAAFGVPSFAINDAHAHGLGEARFGAGQGVSSLLVVVVGTRVGGALLRDGRLVSGGHFAAGQLGHLPVPEAAGVACPCGREGHAEAVASGHGIVNEFRRAAAARGAGDRPDYAVDDARSVSQKAREFSAVGELAKAVLNRSGHALGRSIGMVLNMCDPDLVILTGGVAENSAVWARGVAAGIAREALPWVADCRVSVARLGADAALIGAAAEARDRALLSQGLAG